MYEDDRRLSIGASLGKGRASQQNGFVSFHTAYGDEVWHRRSCFKHVKIKALPVLTGRAFFMNGACVEEASYAARMRRL